MSTLTTRLGVMMFLQFFIWGGWFVTLGTFLGNTLNATGGQIGMAYATQSWGAILAPFVVGLIADRFVNAERLLAILHLGGAVLLYLLYQAADFTAFYPLVLAYMVVYMPTLGLVNAVAFRQLRDPAQQFSKVRVWGTIGWVVAGLVISFVFAWDAQQAIASGALRNTFLLCAVASLVLGLYSFSLPATPPVATQAVGLGRLLGFDALQLLKDRGFATFFVASILICIPLAFYYQNANLFLAEIGVANPTGMMTLGQVSEILFMLLVPVFIRRFGIKKTLLVGMAAWALRYVFFAYGNSGELMTFLIMGIVLHGLCYDFFFVSGQIYTDGKAGESIKSSAQGLITLATYGVGMLIGFWVAGAVSDHYSAEGLHDWQGIWLFPAVLSGLVLLAFLVTFRERESVTAPAPEATRGA
ncbi:nucleoside permease [Pseudomonas sp. GD03944]|uniref:nucleoside permease n=1 Tax=Pseudomonas sp. GD03944 TaxID=2975409 RepID=UPI00244B5B5B|nr:nucleoside permease [Pseudomonas sp. GD03944]MDH1265688.1 nucleoside permease [Pseudomonas sp. GD03944]